MTTSVFCCRKLIVHIHVFRRSTMKVPAFSNFLISLKSLIYPEKLDFIGESYKKYIELFNHCYEEHYKRDFSSVFFDCTNYYFEIDLPKEDNQKGPSKENRHEPIIGQALLLNADLVPLAMQMYPGNESEKPYLKPVRKKKPHSA